MNSIPGNLDAKTRAGLTPAARESPELRRRNLDHSSFERATHMVGGLSLRVAFGRNCP